MTAENQNSPLLDNGSLTHVLRRWRFVETDLVWNALSMSMESTNNFHGYVLNYIRSHAQKNDSFVRHSSFKAVAVEEVTDL
jgi:ribosomal protein L19